MTNTIAIYEQMNQLQTAAQALHASGFFKDTTSQAQAMVKVMAGAELGLPPFASMTGIHIVQGKPVLGANLVATLVKNDPRYDYHVKQADNTVCVLTWYEGGAAVGESSFTMSEATAAGLTNKPTWKSYPSDMLFARALTRGARRYAPGIFGGAPIYTPEELGVDTDEDGHIIDVTPRVIQSEPRPDYSTDTPMTDAELTVYEVPGKEFFSTVAALLETDADGIKARMKNLGYTAIPGKPDEKVAAYRRLRDGAADAAQDDLFGDAAQPPAANGAYQE